MLFLSQAIHDSRQRLLRELKAGKIAYGLAFDKLLELDPDDYVALLGLGHLRYDEGDFAEAQQYLWRAIEIHPVESFSYLELARLLAGDPESTDLAKGLADLAISWQDDDELLEDPDVQRAGLKGKGLEISRKLSGATRHELISQPLLANREDEPQAVTERLLHFRLLVKMREEGDLNPKTVDALVAQGQHMVPLLVGVLRAWARDLLGGDEGDTAVRNALALLGESASATEIPHLLEFVDLKDRSTGGVAAWALGRIAQRCPREWEQVIGSIASGLRPGERLAVANQVLSNRGLDPGGHLLERLIHDVGAMTEHERDSFFPLLLGYMAAAKGRAGIDLGHKVLREQGSRISPKARRLCDDLLQAVVHRGKPPLAMQPVARTVYEICAGQAVWDEDEEGDDEELEGASQPQLVRKAVPGRNDSCWCGSGKKYKKCHLDADEGHTSQSPRREAPALPATNEFDGLRRRLGDFLGEVMHERDFKRALKELFGDEMPEENDRGLSVTDWMIHDMVSPGLRRTVLAEFLIRHGSSLTIREREMAEAWAQSVMGLYEVQELNFGTGLTVKNLLSGEECFVHDISMSKGLALWDVVFARMVPGERGTEFSSVALGVSRQYLEPLRRWMEQDRQAAGLEWHEYLKRNWARIRRQSFEIAATWMDSLRISNTDGEELLLCKAVYKMTDTAAVIAAMRRCAEFEDDGNTENGAQSFVWLNDKKTMLGSVRIAGDELILESNSKERAARGKRILIGQAGKLLRHLRDEFTTQEELRRKAKAGPPSARPDKDELPREVRDQAIRQVLEKHYRGWPDTNLPGLDGKTPRAAVRTANGRERVMGILKDMENGEARKHKAGEPSYDISRLRAELGLEQ